MKKFIILLVLILTVSVNAQYKVEKIKGIVKAQTGSSENWLNVNEKTTLDPNTVVMTEENSSIQIYKDDTKFILKESSVLTVSNIRKMSLDELILALAMEDMINAPKKKDKNNTKNTAVYGTKENEQKDGVFLSNDFGVKKLNGAKQLAEYGFKESALISAKETYRKYPDTKKQISYRIYFADILIEKGLYEDAYEDFISFKEMEMTGKEKETVNNRVESLSKKLVSN